LNKNLDVRNIRNDVRTHITCSYIIIRMYVYARSIDSAMRIVRILRAIPMDCTANNAARYQNESLKREKDKSCVDVAPCTVG